MDKDLIIFSGQSNMQGEIDRAPEFNEIIKNASEYRYGEKKCIPLKHPAGETIDVDGKIFNSDGMEISEMLAKSALLKPVNSFGNMVPFFAKEYIECTGREVVSVHAAKGSTVIDDWLPGGKSFDMLIKKSKEAIKYTNPERIFFVWLQGESDAGRALKKDEYKKKMIELNEILKKYLNIEKFGNILVGEFKNDERDFEIINAQKEVCRENSDFIMLTEITEKLTKMPEYMNPLVKGHYNLKGLEKIGKEAAKKLAEYVNAQ